MEKTKKEIKNLKDFAQEYGDRYFWIATYSQADGRCGSGGFFEEDWLGCCVLEGYEMVSYEPTNFKLRENGCEFTLYDTQYFLTLDQEPKDKWGNTANFEDGAFLKEGCYEVFWDDEIYYDFVDDFKYPEWIRGNDELMNEFQNWFLDNYSNYDFLSAIKHQVISSDFCNDWSVITTNKAFDSQEWQQLFADFKSELEV